MLEICSAKECERASRSRGYCSKHYERLLKYGDPYFVKVIHGHPEVRFWLRVEKTDTCWLWKGRPDGGGYGTLIVGGVSVKAHRYSFFLAHNRHPEPWCLHTCPNGDNRLCVNPSHLREGTVQDNVSDMMVRGGHVTFRGSSHRNSKLTESGVLEIIRRLHNGETQKLVAQEYGVSRAVVNGIARGRVWRHVHNGI